MANQLAQELKIKTELPEIYRNWALFFLKEKRLKEAHESIEQSLILANEMDATQQKGMSLRVLGQIQVAEDQHEFALKSFRESTELLAYNPYEIALTHTQWALGLLEIGSVQKAREILGASKNTFEQLGANRIIIVE